MKAQKKWNSLDVIILVMAIAVIAIFLNRNVIFKPSDAQDAGSGKVEVFFEAEAFKQTEASGGGFVVGDKITAQNKYQDGVIETVEMRGTLKTKVAANGALVTYEDPLEKIVVIGIRAKANKLGPYMEIGGQALKVGGNYFIKTDNAEIYGKIKTIEVIQ